MVVHRLGVSQQRHLRTQRRSWGGINPRFHAANLKRPVVSRETEVVFQRRSVLTWGSAAPSRTRPQTSALRREADGKGRFQSLSPGPPTPRGSGDIGQCSCTLHECSRHHSHQRPRCHDLETLTHHETTNHSHLGRLSVRRCRRASA